MAIAKPWHDHDPLTVSLVRDGLTLDEAVE